MSRPFSGLEPMRQALALARRARNGGAALSEAFFRVSVIPMATTDSIDPQIAMGELTRLYPGARRALFRRYHIGGCSSCGFSDQETLEQVCARNNALNVGEVIEHLLQSHQSDLQMQIAPVDAAAALANSPNARLLDIRTREEFDAVHVEGGVFFTQELMQEILQRWDRSALLMILDHTGARSMDAAAYFAGHGFTQVKAVRGGIDAWSLEADPSLPQYELE
jgi:rhodanese-related sulfurtransferase